MRGAGGGSRRPRRGVGIGGAITLVASLLGVLPPGGLPDAAAAPPSPLGDLFAFDSKDDYIGQGERIVHTDADEIFFPEYPPVTPLDPAAVTVTVSSATIGNWWAELEAPEGATLEPGTYLNAASGPSQPEIRIYGNGRACNGSEGAFHIHELGRDAEGRPISLAASFEHRCEDSFGLLVGRIRVNSAVPIASLSLPDTSGHIGAAVEGEPAEPRTLSMTADGDLPVAMDSVAVAGGDAEDFRLLDDGCSGVVLEVGESCSVIVEFTPLAPGARSSELVLTTDLPLPRALPLGGWGLIPTETSVWIEPDSSFYSPGVAYAFEVSPNPGGDYVECIVDGDVYATPVVNFDGLGRCLAPRVIGQHTFAARFLGGTAHGPSESEALTFEVSNETRVTAASDGAGNGGSTRLTATVDTSSDLLYPGGSLELRLAGSDTLLGSMPVDFGSNTLVVDANLAPGTHVVEAEYSGVSGILDPASAALTVVVPDSVAPTISGLVATAVGPTTTAGALYRLSWSSGDVGVGVETHHIERSVAGTAWSLFASDAGTSLDVVAGLDQTTAFRVRSVDKAGNVSSWSNVVSVTPTLPAPPPPPPDVPPTRQAGTTRYGTAAAISAATFSPGVPVAYVALGTNFPDALAAAAAAGHLGGPVLLVTSTGIPAETGAELVRLRPGRIVVAGSAGVVSDSVLAQLDRYTTGSVTRQYGANRYGTAAAISAATFHRGTPVAYVALGTNFPDALSAAAAAGSLGGPVLLVTSNGIPTETALELARLAPGRIFVAGSAGVVSDRVLALLKAYTVGPVTRQYGGNRYGTAAAISAATFSPGVPVAYVALGTNFPDALAAAAAGGTLGGPVLLVTSTSIPPETAAELTRLKPVRIIVAGGPSVVSDGVLIALQSY